MLFKFSQVYNVGRQYEDHLREVQYAMRPPRAYSTSRPNAAELYIHPPKVNRANGPAAPPNGINGSHADEASDDAAPMANESAVETASRDAVRNN